MLYPNEPSYNIKKPPIMMNQRKAKFVCVVCKKAGEGAYNSIVHQGDCRRTLTKQMAKRNADRKKAKASKLA